MEQEITDFRPRIGDTSTPIPVALEQQRVLGMARYRSRLYFTYGFIPLFIILDLVFLFGSSIWFPWRVLWLILIVLAEIFIIRFAILEERDYRRDIQSNFKNDYRLDPSVLWGVLSIDPEGVIYFTNGLVGVMARFEKNVRVGRDTDLHHFEHYEAVTQAYRIAGQRGCSVTYVDYMGSGGMDTRLEQAKRNLTEFSNEDVREVMQSIYDNLENRIKESALPADVFLLTMRGYSEEVLDTFDKFAQDMLVANYVGYSKLSQEDMEEIVRNLWGLPDFNLLALMSEQWSSYNIIQPITLIKSSGETEHFKRSRSSRVS